MPAVVPLASPEPASPDGAPVSTWTRLLLEDDQDLWRLLIVSFGSVRVSQTVSRGLGFGATVAVFVSVLGLLLQVVDSQETEATNATSDDQASAFVWSEAAMMQPGGNSPGSAGQNQGWQPLIGSAMDDQDYTFGSIDSGASERGIAASQPAGSGPLALNSTSSTASSTSSTASGATMRGFGGGGPGLKPSSATQATALQVPDSTSSALLMGLALLAILGLSLAIKRQAARTSHPR